MKKRMIMLLLSTAMILGLMTGCGGAGKETHTADLSQT